MTVSEKQASGAGYIIAFFTDIENLLSYYSNHKNQLLKTDLKAGGDKSKIDEEDRRLISQNAESVKHFIFRTYIKFSALKERISELKKYETRIDELYNSVKEEYCPNSDSVEAYCIELNKLFVDGIVSSILVKAKEVYEQYLS